MKTDIDSIIDLMKRFTPKPEMDGEIGEQDAGGASSGTKWRDIVKINRGKANTLL